MSTSAEWRGAYARQADADFRAWELYERYPEAVATECHKLLFLQMACEKLCKAHLLSRSVSPRALQTSHAYIAGVLPVIVREQILRMRQDLNGLNGVMQQVSYLANEIEVLNPAVDRDGRRPENCEYPWDDAAGVLHSPLNWTFHPSRLLIAPTGRTFLKLVRIAISRVITAN